MWICLLLQTSIFYRLPRKDAVPFEPIKSLTDAKPEVVMRSTEFGFEDHVIQVHVGLESGTNVGGLEGKSHGDTEHGGVKDEVFVVYSNSSPQVER